MLTNMISDSGLEPKAGKVCYRGNNGKTEKWTLKNISLILHHTVVVGGCPWSLGI